MITKIKLNTLKSRKTCVGVLAQRMPDVGIQEVTTKMLAAITDEYKAKGKARMAQTLRSVWIDLFRKHNMRAKLSQDTTRH
ncbi:phage integrase family site-specific recombinase [Klebsiella variicola]|nr:phage integrase family site-specific recombinase [Klebsiella variicola]